jgi:NAD(P)H-nitrite reductase large subunit
VAFADALAVARVQGCRTVAELQLSSDLGTGCGLCIPYMQRALITGETDLPVLGEQESALLMERSGITLAGEAR